VTPGRNNPLRLKAQPAANGFAFIVCLAPDGDDSVCHLQMEVDPTDNPDLREVFDALRTALVA
jgi:hypothetical protein